MARIWANNSFNIDLYNFYVSDSGATEGTFEYIKNANKFVEGSVYKDWISIGLKQGFPIGLGGTGFDIDFDRQMVLGGTINGFVGPHGQGMANAGTGIDKISVSLKAYFDAFETPSTVDDKAIIRGALAGNDTFNLSNQADLARGFAGKDLMNGRGGDDSLYGGAGTDTLHGDGGNDRLFGDDGSDVIHAGTGTDRLVGGAGADQLHGGTDAAGDVFDFNRVGESGPDAARDTIYNFTSGADHIDLRDIDARAGGTDDAFFWSNRSAGSHDVWWTKTSAGVIVHVDATGDAKADMQILLAGIDSVVKDDFLL